MSRKKIKKSADALVDPERKRWTRRYEVLIGNTLYLHAQFPMTEFHLTAPKECQFDDAFKERFLEWANEYMHDVMLGLIPSAGCTSELGFPSDADHEDV